MRNRFVTIGAFALVVALLSSVWLLGWRTSTPSDSAELSTSTELSTPASATPIADVSLPPIARSTVDMVVRLDGVGGAGAFATPGDRVDVLVFIPAEINQGQSVTRVLLLDVAVLPGSASGSAADTALTIGVTPEQALLVRSAQSLGARMFAELRSADTSLLPVPLESVSDREIRALLEPRP